MATEIKAKFPCRIEELTPIADMLKLNFERDINDFINLVPSYGGNYLINFGNKITTVEAIVNPISITGRLKVVTNRLYVTMESTRDYLNKLEIFIGKATGLTMDPKDFGISEVRNEITQKDAEGFTGKLNTLLQNVDANFAALQAAGYTQQARTETGNIYTSAKDDNTKQNEIMEEREAQVQANMNVLNELWDIMSDVMKTGKALYKESNSEKVGDYTMAVFMERVRQEGEHGDNTPA